MSYMMVLAQSSTSRGQHVCTAWSTDVSDIYNQLCKSETDGAAPDVHPEDGGYTNYVYP